MLQDMGLTRFGKTFPAVACAALFALAGTSCGGRGSPGDPVEYRAGLRRILEDGLRAGEYPGVSCILGTTAGVLFRENVGRLGLVPREEGLPVVPIYDLELATGTLTALFTLSLVDGGYLALDRPIAEYLPAVRGTDKENLTLLRLLSRSSGIGVDPDSLGHMRSREQVLASLLATPRTEETLEPARDGGMLLLGFVLEHAGRSRLDSLMTEHLFHPAGMKDTRFDPPLSLYPRIAPGEVQGGEYRRGQTYYPGALPFRGISAAAGIFSTAEDMGELCRILLDTLDERTTVVTRETFALMATPHTPYVDHGPPEAGRLRAAGLGWDVYTHGAGRAGTVRVVAAFARTGCTVLLVPEQRFYLVLLTNLHHPDGSSEEKRRALRARVHVLLDYALENLEAGRKPGEG